MNEISEYDAIVIGAGVAGLSGACYLAKAGHRVLLVEKEVRVGGLVNSFSRHGFTFDGGARALEDAGVIMAMLAQLGIEMEFVDNPVALNLGGDLVALEKGHELEAFQKLLLRNFPEARADIDKLVKAMAKATSIMSGLTGRDNPLFVNDPSNPRYLISKLLPWLAGYPVHLWRSRSLDQSIGAYLRSLMSNEKLIALVQQHFFNDTPALFALSYLQTYSDYHYPKGGTGVFTTKLAEFFTANQGTIALSSKIVAIHPDENRITDEQGNNYKYKKMIWAGDSNYLYDHLKSNVVDDWIKIESVKRNRFESQGNDSIISFFLEIDLEPEYFEKFTGSHGFYTPGNPRPRVDLSDPEITKMELINAVVDYLGWATYEISCPALRDSSLAPAGQTGLIVSTFIDYQVVARVYDSSWYEEFKNICTHAMVRLLDERLIPGIREKVLFSSCSTPLTIEKLTGNFQGAVTGWSFSNETMPCVTRPEQIAKSILTPFTDIYQAGQWTFSPSGVPISIMTGKLAADRVDRELKRKPLKWRGDDKK